MSLTLEKPKTDHDTMAEAVLASHFTLVAQPDRLEIIEIDGAEGWTSPHPHPVLSLLRWTTPDRDTAAAALDAVQHSFREHGRGFDWMTGPRCARHGLVPLLGEHGFLDTPLDVAGMAMSIGAQTSPPPDDTLRIEKVANPSDPRLWRLMAQCFDVPDEVAAIYHHAYIATSPLQRTDLFAAYAPDDDTPLGIGYLSYIGDGPAVLLRVSCTRDDCRGRGIYRALVQQRLHEAARQGRSQAFVHAYSPASQRCLDHLGFRIAGMLQLHRWRP